MRIVLHRRGTTGLFRPRNPRAIAAVLLALIAMVPGPVPVRSAYAQQRRWVAQGPRPNTKGQVEGIAEGEVEGAISAIAAHPKDASVLYVGAVNGGIWKTENAKKDRPHWSSLTDTLPSLCIGALVFDAIDGSFRTLVAGTGQFSNIGDIGVSRGAILRTTDGGATWAVLGGDALEGVSIRGVAARGSILLAVGGDRDTNNRALWGLWRSTNLGADWSRLTGARRSGLPDGLAYALAEDRSDLNRFYTAVGTGNASNSGVYRSTSNNDADRGRTWVRVGTQAMHDAIATAGNVKIAVGAQNNVYVAVVDNQIAARLVGVFRSDDGDRNWTSLGLPHTNEFGSLQGIHPGGQGRINLSLAAEPSDPNIVYIGGDTQPRLNNSIGARDWSGRLFRGNAAAAGNKWVHLTHGRDMGGLVGGGTLGGSAPHSDSRDMQVNAEGDLLEADDGGLFVRTNPMTNNGDWFSRNGDIQVTEFHAVAWDPISHVAVSGAQDTGSPEHSQQGNPRWRSVGKGDGGVVAVDKTSTQDHSIRYSSSQGLGGDYVKNWYVRPFRLRRYIYDRNNARVPTASDVVNLRTAPPDPEIVPQFYTPIRVNAAAPDRLIIGAHNGVYESRDSGEKATLIGGGITVNSAAGVHRSSGCPIASGAVGDPEILYVGADRRVFVRTAATGTLNLSRTFNSDVQGIAIDPDVAGTAYLTTKLEIFRTTDAGQRWEEITGDLILRSPGVLRSLAYVSRPNGGLVVVGTDTGVFSTPANALPLPGTGPAQWTRLGTGLPRVPVMQMEYDAKDDLVLAGTFGRGAWTLSFGAPPPAVPPWWFPPLIFVSSFGAPSPAPRRLPVGRTACMTMGAAPTARKVPGRLKKNSGKSRTQP
jgi:hypothetical protein